MSWSSPAKRPRESGFFGRARRLIVDITPLKESRQFRLLWLGQSVSDVGSRITMVAVPFQIFDSNVPFSIVSGGIACILGVLQRSR